MITNEEMSYYAYLGAFYQGSGRVVELGPWLGQSTFKILEGLIPNPNFKGERLFVFDDFIWRSAWMDAIYDRFGAPAEARPENHHSFEPLFKAYTKSIAQYMQVQTRRISTCKENSHLSQVAWENGPIEICYVDCGRTIEANEAWYRAFRPSFVPGKTLIVMQDWQVHKELPAKWYNQTRQFTESKGAALDLIHELCHGTTATFLYRG